MMIYLIRLSKKKKEADFEKFMKEVIFPDVPKVQLRNGKIDGLVLLKGNNTGVTNEYIWMVYGGINGGAAVTSLGKIVDFGASVKPLHQYVECASWFADKRDRGQETPIPLDL